MGIIGLDSQKEKQNNPIKVYVKHSVHVKLERFQLSKLEQGNSKPGSHCRNSRKNLGCRSHDFFK